MSPHDGHLLLNLPLNTIKGRPYRTRLTWHRRHTVYAWPGGVHPAGARFHPTIKEDGFAGVNVWPWEDHDHFGEPDNDEDGASYELVSTVPD